MKCFHLPAQTRVSEVHLRARSLEKALRFYQELLGLNVIERNDSSVALAVSRQSPALLRITLDPNAPVRQMVSYKLMVPCGEVLFALEQRAAIFGYECARDSSSSNVLWLRDPLGYVLEVEAELENPDSDACNSVDTLCEGETGS